MSLAVKKVELVHLLKKEDITEKFAGNSIDVTLADGNRLTIELFERDGDHAIEVRAGTNRLHITPVASNVIKIGVER